MSTTPKITEARWIVRHYAVGEANLAEMETADLAVLRNVRRAEAPEAAEASASFASRDIELVERLPGVALIPIYGLMWKGAPRWLRNVSDTGALERMVLMAKDNPRIHRTVVHARSGGGIITGVGRFAEALYQHSLVKPIDLICEDVCASAAAWGGLSIQKRQSHGRVIVDEHCEVGAFGIYTTLTDISGWESQVGIKRVVISTGKYKGLEAHADVPEDLIEDVKRLQDKHLGAFLAQVGRGRNLPEARMRELADGRVHVGQDAIDLGFADEIGTLDAYLEDIANPSRTPAARADSARRAHSNPERENTMGDTPDTNTQDTPQQTPSAAGDMAALRELAASNGQLGDRLGRLLDTLEQNNAANARQAAALQRGEASNLAATFAEELGDGFTPAMRLAGADALLTDLAVEHLDVQGMGAEEAAARQLGYADAEGTMRNATRWQILCGVLREATASRALGGRNAITGGALAGAERNPGKRDKAKGSDEPADPKAKAARAELKRQGWSTAGIDEMLAADPELDEEKLLANMTGASFNDYQLDGEADDDAEED